MSEEWAILWIRFLCGIVIWFLCGIVAAMIGGKKGEGCAALIVGVIFGPFGIVFAILSKGNRKTCPYCKELVHKDASVCPYCQGDIAAAEKQAATQEKSHQEKLVWAREQLSADRAYRSIQRAAKRREFYGICRKWTAAHSAKIVIVALALMIVAALIYLLPLLYDLLL